KTNKSKIGKVSTAKKKIYEKPTKKNNYIEASSTHTYKVFYIKAQAKVNNQVCYLISNKPSSKNGTVGWVNNKDITTYSHVAVDNKSKTFYFKWKGDAYNQAWGGDKNKIFDSNDFAKM